MKKCPTCDKTFDDSMRFCQTDGTPLVEFAEAVADDPLKTTVVRQDELASVIPAEDPFKSSAIDSSSREDSGDLLQLPEEFDPMKTVVSRDEPKFEADFNKPKEEFSFQTPKIEATPPEPPKFNEPSLSPPVFGDMSAPQKFETPKVEEEPPPTAIYMPESNPFSAESSTPQTPVSPFENVSNSPFNKPPDKPASTPIPSPFDDPKPVIPSFKEPEPAPQFNTPFETPSPFGGGQMEQQNQGFNQPVQNSDWTPPPAPNASWQDQGVGANTPFQPPVVGGGQDQTMAIVSLVCGIAGFLICQLVAPVALITGYMARNKAKENPNQYGGEGLALAGMILGAIGSVLLVLVIIYFIFVFGLIASGGLN